MSHEFYKLLHFAGVFMTLFAIAGVLIHAMNGGTKASNSFRKGVMITHGTGLSLVFVSGFGLLAKLGMTSGFPLWVLGKILIWLTFGGIVAMVYKKPQTARSLWTFLIMLAVVAAFLGGFKPT